MERKDIKALFTLYAGTLLIFAPLLFGAWVFSGEEQIGFYYALAHHVDRVLSLGEPLSWLGSYYGGVALNVQQFASAWFPLHWLLFTFFSPYTGWHVSIFLGVLGGLLGAYVFGRLEGLRSEAAFILACGYFSATTFGWLQVGTLSAYSFLSLPWVLVALWYVSERKHVLGALCGGGFALGIGLLAGTAQIFAYTFPLMVLYALHRDLLYRADKSFLLRFRAFGGLCVILFTGLLISLSQWLPTALLLEETIRTSTFALQHIERPYLTQLISFFVPPYFVIPFFNGGNAAGMYVTPIGLVFCVAALLYVRSRIALLFFFYYVAALAFAFHLPVFSWFNEHVAPYANMSGNFRWTVAGAFPLAFLAALGFEEYLRYPRGALLRMRVISNGAYVISGLLVVGSMVLAYITSYLRGSRSHLEFLITWYTEGRTLFFSPEHYSAVLASALEDLSVQFSLGNPKYLWAVATWVLVGLSAAYLFRRPERTHIVVPTVVALSVVGSVVMLWGDFVPRSMYETKPEVARILHEREPDPRSYRVMGFLVGDGVFEKITSQRSLSLEERAELQREILTADSNVLYDIDRMDGFDPYRSARVNHLVNAVIANDTSAYALDSEALRNTESPLDTLYLREIQRRVTRDEKSADFLKKLSLLSMMNVRYIFSPYELVSEELTEVARIPLLDARTPLVLYENSRALPRLYISKNQQLQVGSDAALLGTMVAIRDFSDVTLVECSACSQVRGDGVITLAEYGHGHIAAGISVQSDGAWVVLSETYMPGWHAFVDGKEVPIVRANYLFQAVFVPHGAHRVQFTYRAPGTSDLVAKIIKKN